MRIFNEICNLDNVPIRGYNENVETQTVATNIKLQRNREA